MKPAAIVDKPMHELLRQLVAIDSVNPALVPGAAGEAEIANFVADWLMQAGIEHDWLEQVPGRPSVLARVPGTGSGRSLLLYAHTDTVGVLGMDRPHSPVVPGDRLYARGAYDMKSGLAAILLAAAEVAGGPRLRGDLWVMAVADEEHGSLGVQQALSRLAEQSASVDGCIVTEPTDLQACISHRGLAWITITTWGQAAHTSRRAEGIDAIAHMGRIVVALEQFDRELQLRPAHPLLGHGAVVASLISGGSELFTYPARCRIDVVRRTLPGETVATVTAEIEQLLRPLREADPQFSPALELGLFRAALETPADAPVVEELRAAASDVLGQTPTLAGATFWTDAGLIAEAGIPVVVFGPRGGGLHSECEWVDLPSVHALREVLTKTIRTFCQSVAPARQS